MSNVFVVNRMVYTANTKDSEITVLRTKQEVVAYFQTSMSEGYGFGKKDKQTISKWLDDTGTGSALEPLEVWGRLLDSVRGDIIIYTVAPAKMDI